MPSKNDLRRQLNKMLDELKVEFEATNDAARKNEIEALAGRINDALDRLALGNVFALVDEVAAIRQLIDGGTSPAAIDFDAEAAQLRADADALIDEILANSSEEEIAVAPVPKEEPIVPQDITAPPPAPAATSALELTEAHLIALWKRSQYPLPTSGMVVFGLRGCRPVDQSGTPLADRHALEMRDVNYQKMNCCLGQWRANQGFALFPGSTVPFHKVVDRGVSEGGRGVNQMGCGRYKRYGAGWHKRSDGNRGHWALRQDCLVTLQRTKNNSDYEEDDPWFIDFVGDNIHCAFGMGPESEIPESKFSSAGCQVVAGRVTKSVIDSERGPWGKFIAPFKRALSQEFSETEYVLFDATEAQQMIVNQCAGKTVILRFGSKGPLVKRLQAGLKANGFEVGKVDGDFGKNTFQKVLEAQQDNLEEVDGVVGPETAASLGLELPQFDFDDAIAGGPGYRIDGALAAGARRPLAWGQDTSGEEFNQAVVDMCARLNVNPDHMMAVMAFETSEKFSPTVKNKAGSGATGLIQFMPATAQDLGTDIAHLEGLTDVQQLKWVEKFFRRVAGGKNLASLSDVYMAVLFPKAIGKPESFALFTKGVKEPRYTQNKGLDTDGTGTVTKVEAATKVQQKLRTGLKDNHIG